LGTEFTFSVLVREHIILIGDLNIKELTGLFTNGTFSDCSVNTTDDHVLLVVGEGALGCGFIFYGPISLKVLPAAKAKTLT
jgi:hypothetical protein